jgi:hypothetical protein
LSELPTVREAVAFEGGFVSPDNFIAGLSTLMPTSTDGVAPIIIVDSHVSEVVSSMALPGETEEYLTIGSPKRGALSIGLQEATCGTQPLSVCRVEITGISRRRLQSIDDARRRRLQSSAEIEFAVTATVDVTAAVQPDAFTSSFVAAVQRNPDGALGTLSTDDVAVQEPQITTTIEYTVVLPDADAAAAAAATLGDPSVVAAGVATAVPGIRASPIQPRPPGSAAPPVSQTTTQPPAQSAPAEADDGSIVTALVAALVIVSLGAAAMVVYMQRRDAAGINSKMRANPMFAELGMPVDETSDTTGSMRRSKGGKDQNTPGISVHNPLHESGSSDDEAEQSGYYDIGALD